MQPLNCKNCFRRERLPHPEAYYRNQGLELSGHGQWRSARCPFHDDNKPSLRIKMDKGCFCCMACGAKGGDVLAFHMKRYHLNFINAARKLGAWEQNNV